MHPKCALLSPGTLLVAALFVPAAFAQTTYDGEDAFLAALGPHTTEGFDGFDSGTPITDQIPGLVFFSSGDTYGDIGTFSIEQAVSPPNILTGGVPLGFELPAGIPQVILVDLSPALNAIGFFVVGMAAGATEVHVEVEFSNENTADYPVPDSDEDASTPEFFGIISDVKIVGLAIRSGFGEGGFFDVMGIDDLIRPAEGSEDCCAPICSGVPASVEGILGIDGTGSDTGEFATGIASVALADGAANAGLGVTPFEPGSSVVSFRIEPIDPALDGHATVIVTDGDGRTCTLPVTFDPVPSGPTEGEAICAAPGVLLVVSNALSSPGGQAACSAPLRSPGDPALPPGYEDSPSGDPFPCRTMTITSPISGPTTMVYKKDGDFEPRLRLMYSRFDGAVFPPFNDITESIDQIATVTPDPTRIKGGGTWSQVKVTCAILAELCNGADDDGDGLTDEGLPVAGPPVDADGDGYALCAAAGTADCNDQIGSIHPGAAETCDGMDDDCDGDIDEGAPTGGEACSIPGLLGVCAEGETSCADGPMVCAQVNEPQTDVCDGRDNDCDGTTDENYVFGGYLPPVNADGSSIFLGGRVVPFKFRLTTCAGADVPEAVARIRVFPYASGIVGTEIEDVTSPGVANTDGLYRYDPVAGQYIYNLATRGLTRGKSYLVRTEPGDGSHYDVVISLR